MKPILWLTRRFRATPAVSLGTLAASAPRLLFAQRDGAAQLVDSSRGHTFEVLIVLVLFGLALYAVCRSSRRL